MVENLFKAELVKNGLSVPEFADKLGVAKTTVYRWFDNPGSIPLWCIRKFQELLNVSNEDMLKIFFAL